MSASIWLRAEFKEGERRTPLPPPIVKDLINAGYTISVERSSNRAYSDEEYEAVGATLVPTGSWKSAPESTYILGLKELPEDGLPITHTHIYFGHAFKNQGGWQELLTRFKNGNGTLLDLEYLVDEKGRRVAAFGRAAGLVGAGLGLLLWAYQQQGKVLTTPLAPWASEDDMIAEAAAELQKVGRNPKVAVIGALGRCGQGSTHVLRSAGIADADLALWDLEETRKGGPFPELLQYDVIVNCIYLSSPIPPFITPSVIEEVGASRKTSVIVDVSCDTSNPHNPLPIYKNGTTLAHPIENVIPATSSILDVIAIDHLPTLLPRESSVGFSTDLLPHLVSLKDKTPVWERAEQLFKDKSALINQKLD